jgi:hypothetical protein
VYEAVKAMRKGEPKDDMIEWVANQNNILLENDLGDLAIFESYLGPRNLVGHYWFKSRGKTAIKVAHEFLNEVFNVYDAQVISGLTPLTHLGARWMNKHLGFKSYGIIKINEEPYEQFILHRTEYKQ